MAVVDKNVKQLVDRFRKGYSIRATPSGHFRVVGPDGAELRDSSNRFITISGTPASNGKHYMRRLETKLSKAGVLGDENGDTPREHTRDEDLAAKNAFSRMATAEQVTMANQLRKEVEPWLKKLGGWEARGIQKDLALIIMDMFPGHYASLESTSGMIAMFKQGNTPGPSMLQDLWALHDLIKEQDDPREWYFDRVREVRGLQPVTLTGDEEWPFVVELIPLTKLFVDESYQRPMHEIFVRELVLKFDERLVGTIDVSQRGARYAIMDGLQRVSTMKEIGKTAVWAAVYTGMNVGDEASFFFHKNRDRKAIHPYYHFRARLVAGDEGMIRIDQIVTQFGFKLGSTSTDDKIAAIRAVEKVYAYSSPFREECLSPSLDLVKRLWLGRKSALDGELIRGLGRFFAAYADWEIQYAHWEAVLAELGPQLIIGRAKDAVGSLTGGRGSSGGFGIARTLVEVHNTGLPRTERLDLNRVHSNPSRRAKALALAQGA